MHDREHDGAESLDPAAVAERREDAVARWQALGEVDSGKTAATGLPLRHMPTGPLNRVASNRRAREVLGWEPRVAFVEGLHRTIDWYFATQDPEAVRSRLEHRLLERSA